jgi:hypothetical protein
MTAEPLAGWVECTWPGCPDNFDDDLSGRDGWAHGVRHVNWIDLVMVREVDLRAALAGQETTR